MGTRQSTLQEHPHRNAAATNSAPGMRMVTKGAVFALAFAAAVDPATARPNGNAHHAHVNPYSAAASSAQMPLPVLTGDSTRAARTCRNSSAETNATWRR